MNSTHTTRVRRLLAATTLAAIGALGAGHVSAQGGTGGGGTTSTGADLQISGSASTNSPDAGAVYTYTYQVKNSGGSTASAVVFSAANPVGEQPDYATLNGSTLPCFNVGNLDGGSSVQCNIGSLAKGASATIVVAVTAPTSPSTVNHTGTVSSDTSDPNLTNNSKTISVTVKAPTGGVCKGGVCDTGSTQTVAAPCATLPSVSAPVGYYSIYAAIWNTFTIQSCSTGSETVTVQVQERNRSTGFVDYDLTYPMTLLSGQNAGLVLDNDFAAYSTTYDITFTVRDSSGNVLTTASVVATTPGPL